MYEESFAPAPALWNGDEDRGRDDSGRPSLRTEQANFWHSALQLVVSFQEDRQTTACACFKENKPAVVK
jgi:hypothetical protein